MEVELVTQQMGGSQRRLLKGHPSKEKSKLEYITTFFLTMQSWLNWNSYVEQVGPKLKKSTCICILNARIKGVYYHTCLKMTF